MSAKIPSVSNSKTVEVDDKLVDALRYMFVLAI